MSDKEGQGECGPGTCCSLEHTAEAIANDDGYSTGPVQDAINNFTAAYYYYKAADCYSKKWTLNNYYKFNKF